MESNSSERNYFGAKVDLPPRKRHLADMTKCTFDQPLDSSETDLFEERLNNLISSYLGKSNLSLEDTVEASRTAATSAVQVAVRARALAFEKAMIAAMAMANAKKALNLVASIKEEEENKERYLKKKKKRRLIVNSKTVEDLARNVHRTTNSSATNLKGSPGQKSSKNRRLKFNGNGSNGELNSIRVDESTSNIDKSEVVEKGEEAGRSHSNGKLT